jgi:glycosyltransferase involved in cell wall biosynthesis
VAKDIKVLLTILIGHTQMKKVSAIMPVYNRELYLPTAVESVLNQTYNNVELIIVDDGSIDNSISIANEYADRYPDRVKVFCQENQGPSKARNEAIKHAQGDLIAFIDSDDVWAPDKIERQAELFNSKCNVSFVYSGYFVINENNEIVNAITPDQRLQGNVQEKLWMIENTISGGTLMVARETLLTIGGFDEGLQGAENLDLRLRLSRLGDVYFVNECLYYYRKHGSNMTAELSMMNDALQKLIGKHFNDGFDFNQDLYRRVMARSHYRIGVERFSRKEFVKAMPFFWKALLGEPTHLDCYLRLFRCCLGTKLNNALAKAKKRAFEVA